MVDAELRVQLFNLLICESRACQSFLQLVEAEHTCTNNQSLSGSECGNMQSSTILVGVQHTEGGLGILARV